MEATNNRAFYYTLVFSFILHLGLMAKHVNISPFHFYSESEPEKLNIKLVDVSRIGLETANDDGMLATKSIGKTAKKIIEEAFYEMAINNNVTNTSVFGGNKMDKPAKLKDLKLADVGLESSKAIKKLTYRGHEIFALGSNDRNYLSTQNDRAGVDMKRVDIHIPPPKGISDTEFEKVENLFYSFQRRVGMKYINALVIESRKFVDKNPHFVRTDMNSRRRKDVVLEGRLKYDENGNIQRIFLNQTTKIAKIQELFEEVLRKMDKFPNPPKAYQKDGTFEISFQLTVNLGESHLE